MQKRAYQKLGFLSSVILWVVPWLSSKLRSYLKKVRAKKIDSEVLEKLASCQGNKKEDFHNRKKNEEDVQVFGILGATQTLANMENPKQDVNAKVSKF